MPCGLDVLRVEPCRVCRIVLLDCWTLFFHISEIVLLEH